MIWLIRLYPRWWRERYADEFQALLRQRTLRPGDVLDILRCALEARLTRHNRQARQQRRAPQRRHVVRSTSIGLSAVALIAAAGVSGLGPFGQKTAAPGVRLYTLDRTYGARLIAMDPTRLTADGLGGAITLARSPALGSPFEILQSSNGRALAAVWAVRGNGQPVTAAASAFATNPCSSVSSCREVVRTFAGYTDRPEVSIRLPVGVRLQGLSSDGSRLFGTEISQRRTPAGWRSWTTFFAFSTRTGRLTTRVNLPAPCAFPTMYNAVHNRVYALNSTQASDVTTPIKPVFGEGALIDERVLAPDDNPPVPPRPPHLATCALGSRRPAAQVILSGVAYGSWAGQSWTPGTALSPDGRQIAVYEGRTNEVIVVDALHLRILRLEEVSRQPSQIARLAQWFGLAPSDAWAKGEPASGAEFQTTYSPDGRLLYITGDTRSASSGFAGPRSIGIRAVDVASGAITGEALAGQELWWAQPAPDGSALYVCSLSGDAADPAPAILRLDPRTLAMEARQAISLPNDNPEYDVLAR
jgi:hypothetical protein